MKTIKLESDIFNKFSDYLKGTSPQEYEEIVEIQVKYMSKKEKEIEDFNNSVDRLNQIKQMISEGFALNDIKDDPMDLLKKKQADLKAEKKAIEDAEKAEAKRLADIDTAELKKKLEDMQPPPMFYAGKVTDKDIKEYAKSKEPAEKIIKKKP